MKFEDHVAECVDKLGGGPEKLAVYRDVNVRMDQFAHFPNEECLRQHRQFLHHAEGIAYFGRRYGELGRKAAELHVKADCGGHIPKMADYHNGKCDEYGFLI